MIPEEICLYGIIILNRALVYKALTSTHWPELFKCVLNLHLFIKHLDVLFLPLFGKYIDSKNSDSLPRLSNYEPRIGNRNILGGSLY